MNGPLVVVGDVLLDRDVHGTATRLCPDAPVPVLDEQQVTDRAGGAGLAAVLAAADGLDVVLVTALADDAAGTRLRELLAEAGVRVCPLWPVAATPEKIRLRAGGQTLLRLDRGGPVQRPGELPAAVPDLLARAGAILVSDYGRGVAAQPELRRAVEGAARTVPVVWDPHPRGPAAVPRVRLVTPNESELRHVTGVTGASRLDATVDGARALAGTWRAGAVAVTMGADGALLYQDGVAPLMVAATPADGGTDTCGAGDRFAAAAAGALATGALVSAAVRAAVESASAYVAAGGAAGFGRAGGMTGAAGSGADSPAPGGTGAAVGTGPADAAQVVARVRAAGGTVVATGGCFDLLHTGHLATLRAARRLGDCLVVCLNSDRSVAAIKGPDRPLNPETDRAALLAALDCVDAVVVFDEETPHAVLSRLRPDIWVKGGDYAGDGADLPEAELVRGWGGRTVIVPYLDGRSTTGTIAAARSGTGLFAEGRR